jgi:hypothetical protein
MSYADLAPPGSDFMCLCWGIRSSSVQMKLKISSFFFFFEKKLLCIRKKLKRLQYHEYKEDTPHTIISPHPITKHISQAYEQPHLLCVLHG